MSMQVDPRRKEKVNRYKAPQNQGQAGNSSEDLMPDYMNILGITYINIYIYMQLQQSLYFLGMIFSMCGLMMKLKWCAWFALYCSCISFASSRVSDDAKQVLKYKD